MDPLTLTLICLAAGWLIRNTVEDVWAGIRGHESPRIARRRARLQLADTTGSPTMGQAVSGRLATRIANPPERRALGAFRGFLDELIADAWDDARTRHADRRRKRIERDDDTRPDPDNALKTRQCRGRGCDVLVVKPREWCDTCAYGPPGAVPEPEHRGSGDGQRPDHDATRSAPDDDAPSNPDPETPEPTPDATRKGTQPVSTPATCRTPDCGEPAACPEGICYLCDHGIRWMCVQCDEFRQRAYDPDRLCSRCRRDNEAGGPPFTCPQCETAPVRHAGYLCGECVGDADRRAETPEPTPAPDTTRKDTPPMTNPTEINGDVTSPLEALEFATTCYGLNAAVMNELEVMASNLTGEGVGHECVQIVRDAWAAGEQFSVAAANAITEYARHVATQAEIAGDVELRDTVRGTYLDGSRA